MSYDPKLVKPHDETCEKSKSDRKRIVTNGTKRIARFEEKYAPKWEAIMKEETTPINERKMSNEDLAGVLTQMEKDYNGINYKRVYRPRTLKKANARTKTVTSAPKKDDSKDATKNSEVEAEADITISRRTFIKKDAIKNNEVEAEADVTISRRTFIKIDQYLDYSKKSEGPKNKKQRTK